MNGTPTWYDLLDVAPDAPADEVRAAWKTQIADLEPGDRRFDALNRAAKVLLDPAARADYDARLAAEETEGPADEHPPLTEVEAERERERLMRHRSKDQARERKGHEQQVLEGRARHALAVPTWLLAGLALVAAALVAATTWVWLADPAGDDEAARAAQTAAERAVVPVLSYDYEDLAGGQERAQALMTGKYRKEYDKLFTVIAENAPATKTKVAVDVVASGIVRASEDRVQVLVFVDRPTTNKASAEPVVYKDQVTLSMQRVDDEWLVDDMVTSPVSD